MNLGSVCVAYHEPRFIVPHLKHVQIDDRLVLNSTIPWNGEPIGPDNTAALAKPYARVVENYWPTEEEQRNTGQTLYQDKDWVVVLDPDEFLSNDGWRDLLNFLETTDADAVVCEGQYTYWKDGYVADPPKDYQMLIAVRPHVQFVDKRVVGVPFVVAPVWVHHFSWARTNDEVWQKISHYAHAKDFDVNYWYESVWLPWQLGDKDVHPTTPDTLHDFKRAELVLPKELERLNLWPK